MFRSREFILTSPVYERNCLSLPLGYRSIDISDQSLISSSSNQYNGAEPSFNSLVLKANILTPGSKYKFIVNVNDGSKTGSSNMIVEVRSGPTSGTFEATPTSIEQLQQVTLKGKLNTDCIDE